ncbi:MAG: glycosyltransferase [Proteobacteria bacterium]|nr:glycosyltransferase [Pseudomonadota bacterium]
MRATVIIPTYNRPDLLRRQLACFAEQTGSALCEVLVCDDGSSTDTLGAMAPFRDRIPGLRHLWQPDLGFRAGQARNLGIREAIGDVLLFVDDDLLFPADFVERHVAAHREVMNGKPARRVVLGFRSRTMTPPAGAVPTATEMRGTDGDDRVELIGEHGEGIDGHPHPWFFVYSCNFSVPRLDEVTFAEDFEGWGMEDTELGYRLVKAGWEVVVRPEARVLHVEDPAPRDPFRCTERGLPPQYDSYVTNAVQFIDMYPDDRELYDMLAPELRWYVRDPTGKHWIKNGHENDADAVIATVRRERDERTATRAAAANRARR